MQRLVFLIIAGVVALIGIAVLLMSPTLGLDTADAWLRSMGGIADGQKFMVMVTGYGEAYRLLGAVLTAMGLYGCFQQLKESAALRG